MRLVGFFDEVDRHYFVLNLILQVAFFWGPRYALRWLCIVVVMQLVAGLIDKKESFWRKFLFTTLFNSCVFLIGLLAGYAVRSLV